MKITNLILAVLVFVLLSACNTTPQQTKLEKKPLISDHHLLMSLLNRPITADQKMMLAFAKQRDYNNNDIFVNYVNIKGPRRNNDIYTPTIYTALIANDINSIRLQGPK